MPEKLDKKFYGEIRKAKNDEIVPDDEWCVFLAKDNAFAHILPIYIKECRLRGCDEEQLEALRKMYNRVFAWRMSHPERCKDPDAAGEKMLP